ncbi:MAG TPA: dipeptide epimerase [Planctomycetota bacterium]|nr:dipeptide epimerase [Planctomycetota bacterium]
MKLSAEPLDLTLRHTFSTSRSSSSIAHNVLLTLRWGKHSGLGEAAPIRYYGQSQQSCLKALQRIARHLAGREPFEIEAILQDLRRRFPKEPSAIAAVDLALHDLMGKHLRLPVWKLFGLDPTRTPQTSFTIGIDTFDKVVAKVGEAEKYPVLKIKVGVPGDVEIMREVRRLAPKKFLRVDANCGWSVRETIEKARKLERLGVEFIEQPLPPGRNADFKRIRNKIGLPLMTDESSLVPEDIPALRGCVDGINIKLVKCGGIREGLKMIHIARACGLKIMLGCMIESSVLITAAAQLAPLVDYADLDGNLLISDDPFSGVKIDRKAKLLLPDADGLGLSRAK